MMSIIKIDSLTWEVLGTEVDQGELDRTQRTWPNCDFLGFEYFDAFC
ncbi:MAG: hypothetical protein HKN39_02335 [Flavobacteriales bacterium]|nr:hypothetical protein [Flavobacteriales bacterium]